MYVYNLGLAFQQTVTERNSNTAIWFSDDEATSYSDLNKLANRIARFFLQQRVAKNDVVFISGTKSLLTFAAIISCLKIGAVYCILDPNSPVERLRKILTTCKPKLVLAEPELISAWKDVSDAIEIELVDKQGLTTLGSTFDDGNLSVTREVPGSTPAYIMFTSGSTGFPKGAVMTHANVLNLIEWSKATFQINYDDRLTNVNPLYFDNSVFDLYSSLFNGALLVPFTSDEVKDPGRLAEKVDTSRCTLWFSVPSLLIFLQTMKVTDGKKLRSIQRFVFGGEGYPKAKLKKLFDSYSPASKFFNVYGPTECTCICSCYQLSDADFTDLQGFPPLGQIADNFEFLILDEQGNPISDGETGELCLLGPCVGKGYYNDPDRTAGSFTQNPLNKSFSEIMYRTGDMVRQEPRDGKLYIQGRRDNQIKHMGYRIELEEIETALNCLGYIKEAAVLHANVNGLSRLVAVIASDDLDSDQIRSDLKEIIPSYMMPSVFHREDMLPKNANGKIDRRHLSEKYLAGNAAQGRV